MIAIRSVTAIRLKVQRHVRTHVATAPNSESDLSANATKQTRNEERIDEMKATRDQARIDAERSRATVENAGQIITATQPGKFAQAAHRRVRGCDGGYRRDHLRALTQRVEVSEREVRIMGSKNTLLRVLAASNGVESAANDVRIYVPEWRCRQSSANQSLAAVPCSTGKVQGTSSISGL